MGEEILFRLRKQASKVFKYPVAECPSCHELAPCGRVQVATGPSPENRRYCLYCQHISDEFEIQGYVSLRDLEETGWGEDLKNTVAVC
jgi:hypothetical protein